MPPGAARRPGNKAVVVYDTMWHSTERMAEEIVSGLNAAGVAARPMHLRRRDRSDVMAEVLDAKAIIVGSPTLNNGLFPTVSDFLTYMKGLKPIDRIGASFGSYGWSGEATRLINEVFAAMKFDMPEPETQNPVCSRRGRDQGLLSLRGKDRETDHRISP